MLFSASWGDFESAPKHLEVSAHDFSHLCGDMTRDMLSNFFPEEHCISV